MKNIIILVGLILGSFNILFAQGNLEVEGDILTNNPSFNDSILISPGIINRVIGYGSELYLGASDGNALRLNGGFGSTGKVYVFNDFGSAADFSVAGSGAFKNSLRVNESGAGTIWALGVKGQSIFRTPQKKDAVIARFQAPKTSGAVNDPFVQVLFDSLPAGIAGDIPDVFTIEPNSDLTICSPKIEYSLGSFDHPWHELHLFQGGLIEYSCGGSIRSDVLKRSEKSDLLHNLLKINVVQHQPEGDELSKSATSPTFLIDPVSVKGLFPHLVKENDGIIGMNTLGLVPILIASIKAQSQLMTEMQSELETKQQEMQELDKQVSQLMDRVNAIESTYENR